jgi:putative aldouronate transport system substrate-binding protein
MAPNFHAIASEDDKASMLKASTSADGNIYSLTIFEPATWNMTPFRMYINEVWLDKLGLAMPTTTDEYYEVLKAFASQDPNGNDLQDEIAVYGISGGTYGENVTIPLMNSFVYYPATTAANVTLTLSDDGETVIAPFVQEGWKDGLAYMNKLVSEELMPPSVFVDDRVQFMAVLNNEDVNLVGSLSSGSLSRWNDYDNNVNGQEYVMMPALEGSQGIAYSPFMEYNPSPIWFVTSACQNPELAFKLGDYFYKQEISETVRFGEKGVDYTTDPEELAKPQYSNAYIAAGLYDHASLLTINDIWAENTDKFWRNINPRYTSIDDSNASALMKEYDPNVKSAAFQADNFAYYYDKHPEHLLPALTYTIEEATGQADIVMNIQSFVSQSMAQFITGARPISSWDSYVDELDKMGLETWLKNAQAAYERVK